MTAFTAAIPYRTFPWVGFGPLRVHTFGLMVGIGVTIGIVIASRSAARFGVESGAVANLGGWMVVAGVAGARLTWVITHTADLTSPLDALALWKGGLQFSGGFVAAVAVAVRGLRRWAPEVRRRLLDGFALGLTAGLAIGRVGCYSVGEHLGRQTPFFLATRYEGGATREGPLALGAAVHNTSLYEFLYLLALAAILWRLLRRSRAPTPGVGLGLFTLWYGVARLSSDSLRAYDGRRLGLTGAQWLCLAMIPAGVWILASARRRSLSGTAGPTAPPFQSFGGLA